MQFVPRGTQDMIKIFLFSVPFKPGLIRCLLSLVLEGGRKFTKIGIAMGATIGDADAKRGKNTHLLVIMRVRISQKIGLHNLMNQTQFKKGNGWKQNTKIIHDYCGIRIKIRMRTQMSTSWGCNNFIRCF